MMYIYQIYYNQETFNRLSPQFIPLDNSENLRVDWAEYWPIRNFFLNNTVSEDQYYGFFSPKFATKIKISVDDFIAFANSAKLSQPDVIGISPAWVYSPLYFNVFERCKTIELAQQFFNLLAIPVDIKNLVMHSGNTIFSNYFVAKPKFWRRWLELTDHVFQMAENPNHVLYEKLNSTTNYPYGSYGEKVFFIECFVSYMLAAENWSAIVYDTFLTEPLAADWILDFKTELIACDALKKCWGSTGFDTYKTAYYAMRAKIPVTI